MIHSDEIARQRHGAPQWPPSPAPLHCHLGAAATTSRPTLEILVLAGNRHSCCRPGRRTRLWHHQLSGFATRNRHLRPVVGARRGDHPDRRPGQQVVYYEGDESVGIDDLVVGIIDPAGATVAVASYEGELIYETTNLTLGRAIDSFDSTQIGAYHIEVSGVDTGQITVGQSFSRLALPGILVGLAIAGLSLVAGFVLWLFGIVRR